MATGAHRNRSDLRHVLDAKKLVLSFVLALCIHVSLFLGIWLCLPSLPKTSFEMATNPRPVAPQKVSQRRISSSQWAQNRRQVPPQNSSISLQKSAVLPSEKPKEKPRREEVIPKGKVVAVEAGNRRKPTESKFLAESDNAVEKETVSRHRRRDYDKVAATPSAPNIVTSSSPPRAHPTPPKKTTAEKNIGEQRTNQLAPSSSEASFVTAQPSNALAADSSRARGEHSNQALPPKKLSFEGLNGVPLRFLRSDEKSLASTWNSQSSLFPNKLSLHAAPSTSKPSAEGDNGLNGNGAEERHGSQLVTLTPSVTALAGFLQGPASDLMDGDGVPEGEGTYLNTREWKHAGFFNRIKDNVGRHWNPRAQIALKDPTGEAYLYKDRKTLVAVTLDKKGNVKSVRVTHPSGVEFLDTEALDAFRRAGAFPHPPTALQNDRGEITFGFGFYVETSRGRTQLFR